MSFEQRKLSKSINQSRGIFDKYIYRPGNGDTQADLLASGYFAKSRYANEEDWIGSLIEAETADGFLVLKVIDNNTVIRVFDTQVEGLQRKYVRSPEDFDNPIDSTVEYFIDGIVDFTGSGISLEVPATGIYLKGYNFDLSKLICSDNNYKLFTSPVGGSGNFLGADYALEVTGTNSQVYDLTSATGFEAFEFARINYNGCSSLGEINNYRQGFETGTGRFGGTPSLTLSGTWLGGYFIDASIVRGLTDGAYALYSAGAGFTMNSRFRTNQNVDLPASASFIDFSSANFPNPSTVQITQAIITRNGVQDASDPNISPNLTAKELSSSWRDNNGLENTYPGGRLAITTEVTTTINTVGVFELLAGTWTADLLEHFDQPSNGQLRHLGKNPIEYEVITGFVIDGNPNYEVEIRLMHFDDSTSTASPIKTQVRQINSLVGGRDVAFFNDFAVVELDQNDYLYYEIANNTDTSNVTAEIDSFFIAKTR